MNVLRLSPPPAGSAVSLLERLRDLFGDIPREGGRVRKLPPAGQAQGCGFPVLSTLASLDLATGALEQLKLAQWSAHDLRLFLGAPELIARNDIAVADRAFDAFVFLAVVRSRQADAICRVKNNRRALSGAKQRIGPGDWIRTNGITVMAVIGV